MKLKIISKFIIVFVCALLINASNLNSVYADDHTPKRKIINELKITRLEPANIKVLGTSSQISRPKIIAKTKLKYLIGVTKEASANL